MKKITLLLLFTFSNFYAQQQSFAVPETWEIDSWDGTNWNLSSRTSNTFNEDCFPIETLQQVDLGGVLINSIFITTSYNDNNQPILMIAQLWNSNTNSWNNLFKEDYTYSGGNLTELLTSVWVNNTWQQSEKKTSTYSGSENLLINSITEEWVTSSNSWENDEREVYSYEVYSCSVFFISTIEIQDWNGTSWENDAREVYSYANCLIATLESQDWDGFNWENEYREIFYYDGNDYLIEIEEEDWNGTTYEIDSRILITNSIDGNPTEMISQDWLDNNTWLNTIRDTRTYSCLPLAITEVGELINLRIYPNPASNRIHINSNYNLDVFIYDTNGRELCSKLIKQEHDIIDLTNLSNGIYIIKLFYNNSVHIKKLVVKH
ncbi:T9SS type A sorting domain-containing protein [Winogradskyella thalassocola]|nr:T9SS type A sorting domain-containing protein [Winogradskyella thalassocola]